MDGMKLNNPTDPLRKTYEAERELFKSMGKLCNGFNAEQVINAAANVLVNAVRQSHSSRRKAEAQYDELVARLKGVLMEHYDSVSGDRRNIFPFTQTINAPWFDARKQKRET